MKLSYNPLWKLLIDKKLTYKDLMEQAKISKSTIFKMKHHKNITTDVLLRICILLNCNIADIVECVEDNDNE